MKIKLVFITFTLLALILESCSIRRNITQNPTERTDFEPGGVYELKQTAYLWDGSLFARRFSGTKAHLIPGTKLVIRRIEFNKSFEMGPYTLVFAEVLTGAARGLMVNLTSISIKLEGGYTARDPDFLEPVAK